MHTIFDYEFYQDNNSSKSIISQQTEVAEDYPTGSTLTNITNYTSLTGDFLKHNFNGVLTAHFDSITPAGTFTPSLPMTVTWYTYNPTPIVHTGVTNTDVLNGTSLQPVIVTGQDGYTYFGTCTYLGSPFYNEDYTFYDLANRPGDYMQLQSFTMYGQNIYQNAHLLKSISCPRTRTTVSYNIDANSKINQATATIIDTVANTQIITYNLQYETF